jgi:hypothetical protein
LVVPIGMVGPLTKVHSHKNQNEQNKIKINACGHYQMFELKAIVELIIWFLQLLFV